MKIYKVVYTTPTAKEIICYYESETISSLIRSLEDMGACVGFISSIKHIKRLPDKLFGCIRAY